MFTTVKENLNSIFWISIDQSENIIDLDCIIRLQHRSNLSFSIVQDDQLVKNQLLQGEEEITTRVL